MSIRQTRLLNRKQTDGLALRAEVHELERRRLLHCVVPAAFSHHSVGGEQPDIAAVVGAPPGQPLLPDLVAFADESRGYVYGWSMDGGTMPGRALLRLTTAVANLGDGPLELRGGTSRPDGTQEVYQRVYNDGGSTDHLAGSFTFHPEHGHIHFDNFTRYNVREMTSGGGVGTVLRSGQKVSFCLFDQMIESPALPGAPASPAYLDCSTGSVQGISVGWSDVYQKGLPDQWVDVTGLAAGQYWLEVVADPDDHILESDESNNSVRISVQLDPDGTSLRPDRFEPNESFEAAAPLDTSAGRSENFLSVHAASDVDYFRFTSPYTGTVVVDTWPDTPGTGDVDLALFGPDRNLLADSAGPTAQERVATPVVAGQAYYVRVRGAAGSTHPSYTLKIFPPPPTVSVVVSDPAATETGDDAAAFTISRSDQANTPLTVRYTLGGSAHGSDYVALTGTAIIAPFASSVSVAVQPTDDSTREGNETVTLSLAEDIFYAIDPAAAGAAVTIADDEPPQPLPPPWSAADVGAVAVPGGAEVFSDGTIAITGAGGAPVAAPGRADAYQFTHMPLTGNGAVVAAVLRWEREVEGATAGVAIREHLGADARSVTFFAAPDGSLAVHARRASRANARATQVGSATGPVWLRLSRIGNVVTAATSPDGTSWQPLHAIKLKLKPAVYGGMAVSSADSSGAASARFAKASVLTVPAAPRDLNAVAAPGRADLSWLHDGDGETGFVLERSTQKSKRFQLIAELTPDTFAFTHVSDDIVPKRRYFYRVRALNGAGSSLPSQPVLVKV